MSDIVSKEITRALECLPMSDIIQFTYSGYRWGKQKKRF